MRAGGLDPAYYFRFQKNGILQISDIQTKIKSQQQFNLTQEKVLTIDNFRYSYSIDSDKLTIRNLDRIISWTTILKIDK